MVMEQLESEDQNVRALAVAELLKQRHADVAAVLAIVEKYLPDPVRGGTVKDAMLLLGELRAVEAVPLLVRCLTYEVYYKNTKRPQTADDLYPAVRALSDIGSPAIEPVLERVAGADDPEVHRAAAAALRGILGQRRAHAILLQEAQANASAPARQRLRAAAAILDQLP
jgi:HEAT repeat protein